jgi:hypothetical protein
MAAEFIGLENTNQNLEKFNFDAIGVYDKKLEKFKRILAEGETESDLILAFNEWCERMLFSNPMNFKTYSVQLYDMPEGAKKLRGTISFTFALLAPQMRGNEKNNQPMVAEGYITKRELELSLENQRLQFQNDILQKELAEIDEEEEEEEAQTITGVMQETLMGKLPELIDLALMSFAPKNMVAPSMAGVNDMNKIIDEFKVINPEIENDLFLLLNLAKTKPALFNMLIQQLRTM